MKDYLIITQTDEGPRRILTAARNPEVARLMICTAESCPENAIKAVMSKAVLPSSLIKDAVNVCKSIYATNAPYAIGYLFNRNYRKQSVSRGMFCNNIEDIDPDQWTYYYDYKTKNFYEIY